jgi:hypothetical protein
MTSRSVGRADEYGTLGFWERPVNIPGFRNQTITAVPKRGDRLDSADPRHNPGGVPLAVRFIRVPGFQAKGVPPELYPDEGITIERTEGFAKPIGEITEEDLFGMPPVAATREQLRFYLALIDNTEPPGDDVVVTIWRFKYLAPSAV